MNKEIKKQLHRMIFVVAVLLAFVSWQREFVQNAIESSTYLNLIIIGSFLFGLALTFRHLFELDNERVAIEALQESYEDLLRRDQDEIDPHRRFRRCDLPAVVFSYPHIMGQSFSLLSEEMARTSDLKMSAGTMQTLIDGIDARLDEKRSLVAYITGLLVFLGLIGTFIGLMETLRSVGAIIGDLDLSGGSGMETIQRLMNNLKAPLKGMATGFSSSLFGLATSLALGLTSRFQNSATIALKLYFESWLSSVVHITDSGEGAASTVTERAGRALGEQHLRLMYNVARYSLTSSNRTNRILDAMTAAVTGLGEEQRRQGEALHRLAASVEKSTQYQTLMSHHLGRTADALAKHDEVNLRLREIDIAVSGRLDELARSVERSSGNIESLTEEIIRLGQNEESTMDDELQRMMRELDDVVMHNQGERAQARMQASSADPVGEMRGKLTGAFPPGKK